MDQVYRLLATPVGELTLIGNARGLAAVLWEDDDPQRVRLGSMQPDDGDPQLTQAATQLSEYFAGQRTTFDLALDFQGTPFQTQVWQALLTIGYGQTRSYGEIARQIGRPGASRAVGAANARNPISIIAPCHRVVGRNGHLTGFAGGLDVKQQLLDLEQRRTTHADNVISAATA